MHAYLLHYIVKLKLKLKLKLAMGLYNVKIRYYQVIHLIEDCKESIQCSLWVVLVHAWVGQILLKCN